MTQPRTAARRSSMKLVQNARSCKMHDEVRQIGIVVTSFPFLSFVSYLPCFTCPVLPGDPAISAETVDAGVSIRLILDPYNQMSSQTETITGNTYPVREQMRALGGRWNRILNGWDVPAEVANQARAIVAVAGPSTYQPRVSRYRSTYTRFSSGAEIYQNKRGRCEDAPCCGCCS